MRGSSLRGKPNFHRSRVVMMASSTPNYDQPEPSDFSINQFDSSQMSGKAVIDNWMERSIQPMSFNNNSTVRFLLDRFGHFPKMPLLEAAKDEAETNDEKTDKDGVTQFVMNVDVKDADVSYLDFSSILDNSSGGMLRMPLEIPIKWEDGMAKASIDPVFRDKNGELTQVN